MPIHSSNHSLTSYTTVVVVLLLFLQTSTPIIKALAENSHVTNFQSPNLYPESLAWDPLKQHFLVGSLRHRTISSISDAGIIENLISDTSLPKNVTVVGITVDSRNNRVLAVIHAVKPLPPFNALAAYDLKSGNRLFLSPLPTNEEALANNVAVDYNDNAYVTNSIGNYIWKVNVKGEASIFSKSPRFTEHPVDRDTPYSYIGLNGIAYVSSGDYLLVVQSNTGKVFKVDADDGTARHVLLNEDLTRPDGVVFRSDGVVLVVSPQANKLWLLKSNNGWGEGVVYDKIDLESEGYPTSVVSRGRDKIIPSVGPFKTTLPRRIPPSPHHLINLRRWHNRNPNLRYLSPENVTVVGITVDSRNNRVLAVIHAVKPLPPFNALAAYDLKSGNRLFLSPLPTDEEALANNVAVDYNDNAYVTNSIGNYIWKVNVKGEASIFSKSPRFTEHPVDRDTPYSYIGLNGIAYVSSGDYLLVVQSNTGKVFKVDADDGTARHVLLNEDLTRPDGVVFRSDGVVLVVSPQANKLWLLKSNNGWGRGLLGNSEREGFRIEEIMSPKESEGENAWLYVMIGFGMVYFVYWRFQMGQLVKHMNKKII
ncbi:hypothetical protein KIW84_050812 [Lathyrus oleraceus]|uniref:Uncharacterized protein n=1 Tax=Pisum sativum TaxID=3888 RepID=A0A9D4WMS1_PEA|nr:hypothetical protein KIW84_050812 [Pisum sativum]